ncbi:MAG TPA: hypothetical protein VI248_18460 [Kineosporiaceae bacterium]
MGSPSGHQSMDDLDAVVVELRQRHPRFPRVTVARLVRRTAAQVHARQPDEHLALVRREAERQLTYAEEIPDGPVTVTRS